MIKTKTPIEYGCNNEFMLKNICATKVFWKGYYYCNFYRKHANFLPDDYLELDKYSSIKNRIYEYKNLQSLILDIKSDKHFVDFFNRKIRAQKGSGKTNTLFKVKEDGSESFLEQIPIKYFKFPYHFSQLKYITSKKQCSNIIVENIAIRLAIDILNKKNIKIKYYIYENTIIDNVFKKVNINEI